MDQGPTVHLVRRSPGDEAGARRQESPPVGRLRPWPTTEDQARHHLGLFPDGCYGLPDGMVIDSPRAKDGQNVTTLGEAVELGSKDRYLAVVSTLRADGTIQSSVVNAGAVDHPIGGETVLAFVTYGRAKLSNLRSRPQVTVTFRAGPAWAAVEGVAQLVGPEDQLAGIDGERLRLLRREVFVSAGGSHDDWDTYDRVMTETGRVVVLIAPTRVYSN